MLELKARESDKLNETVDYGALARFLTETAHQTEYFLIEKLAQKLGEACLSFDNKISGVEISLEKPGCIENARSAQIVLMLTQP